MKAMSKDIVFNWVLYPFERNATPMVWTIGVTTLKVQECVYGIQNAIKVVWLQDIFKISVYFEVTVVSFKQA